MFCKYCGKEIPDDSVFCPVCGKKLLAVCDNCGAVLPEGSSFCYKCGKHQGGNQPSSFVSVTPEPKTESARQQYNYQYIKPTSETYNQEPIENKGKHKKHGAIVILVGLLVLAICAVCIFLYFQNTNQTELPVNSEPSSQNTAAAPASQTGGKHLTSRNKPVSGTLITVPDYERPCHLTITAPDDSDLIVCLEYVGEAVGTEKDRVAKSYAKEPYEDNLSYYVRAGESTTVQVPIGTYKIYYAMGNTYYGKDALFGDETIYCRIKNELPFLYQASKGYTSYDLDLSMLTPNLINSSEFPAL